MKNLHRSIRTCLVVAGALAMGACSKSAAPNYEASLRTSLQQAGYKDVTVKQDVEKGVVTLGGQVAADADKAQAEALARSMVAGQVVANEIAVLPAGAEAEAKKVNEALDKGIESNLEAALVAERLKDNVKFTVKNHVVTLSGDVESPELRARVEAVATGVPYVHQVVNTLQVRKQKATSSR